MTLSDHQFEVREALEEVRSEFGEDLVVLDGDADPLVVNVIINEPQKVSSDDETAEFETTVRWPVSEKAALKLDSTPALLVILEGRQWHITSVGPERYGFMTVTLLRKFSETEHTNNFDINEEQATWHE